MSKILIGFSRPKKWKPFSALIMLGYNIPYDHVYIKYTSNTYQRNIIYQASHTMVNFTGELYFTEENVIVKEFELEISDVNKVKMLQFAIDNSGKPYGIKAAFGMGLVRICELFGKKISNPFRDEGKTYICSELVGYVLEEYMGVDVPGDVSNMSPKDIYDYLVGLKT